MMSQRDYYEYGTIRNLSIVIPAYGSNIDPKAGKAEREEMMRADRIDAEVAIRQKQERRNFKGY